MAGESGLRQMCRIIENYIILHITEIARYINLKYSLQSLAQEIFDLININFMILKVIIIFMSN